MGSMNTDFAFGLVIILCHVVLQNIQPLRSLEQKQVETETY